jgi:hypothetical protein
MAWVPLEKCPLEKFCPLERCWADLKKIKAANRLPLMKIPDYFCASVLRAMLALSATLD